MLGPGVLLSAMMVDVMKLAGVDDAVTLNADPNGMSQVRTEEGFEEDSGVDFTNDLFSEELK